MDRGELCHLGFREREIEDREVLEVVLLLVAARDDRHALLDDPPERNGRRGAIVRVMRPESYWSPGNALGA